MAAFNDGSLKERDDLYKKNEIDYGRFADVATPDPEDDELEDADYDEDLDDDTLGDDLDDTDFEGEDYDEDDDLEDEDPIAEADIDPEDEEADPALTPSENPEIEETDNDEVHAPEEGETRPDQNESGSSWSEQIDVTPPRQHEFPSEGTATETNFEARPHGRRTGRMIGDDPGTEGI